MDLDTYWRLIEQSGREFTDKHIRARWLTLELAAMPRPQIVDFQIHLDHCRDRIDNAAMWGAAHQICDGLCGGDGFWYFQVWLIGLGRDAFEHAAADPDHLAELIEVRRLGAYPVRGWSNEQWPEWEILGGVARMAYGDSDALDADLQARGHRSRADPRDPGQWWDIDDPAEARRRYPKLAQLFPRTGELSPMLPEQPPRPPVVDDPDWWAYSEDGSHWTEPKAAVLAVFLDDLGREGNGWLAVGRRCVGGEDRVVAEPSRHGQSRPQDRAHP